MKYQQIKKLSRLLLALVMTVTASQLFAQSNDGIFFQAVARDNFSNAAKDRKIFVQTSIIQSTTTGNKLLIEEHQATTDASGVFSISIGNGNRVGGASSSLSSIDWSKGPFFLNLKVAITPIGGNSSWDYTKEWVDMGTTNFGAVPFAYYAAQVAGFDTKLNVSDSAKMLLPYAKTATLNILSANVDTKLNTKLNIADSTNGYVTPSQLAAKTFDQTPITNAIATKLNIADSITKYITPSQLASYNFSSGGGGNAVTVDTASLSNRINLKANASDISTLTTNLASNTAAISAEVTRATAAELLLTNNVASNTASITANTTTINLKANTSDVSNALNLKANVSDISTLTTNMALNATAISAEVTRATAAELVLTNNVASNTASINSNSNALNLKAPLASPTFTGTLTAPIYATTPQSLTSGSTITWNPTLGLNASVTLDQNSTLSFSSTPPSGSYGTLVITQDATGSRTITLPSTTNKVLGSTSSTTIDLSTAANAIDIVNFYYDGINYYWNIGQGYGQAVSSGSTNLASDVTGSLAVANGGTGATTAAAARTNLGLVIGTNVQAPLVAGTDYLAPNGSAANLTNFPTLNQNTTGNAATATLATTATTATNATTAGNITATSNTTLTSLSNLTTVGTITSGTISLTTDIKTTSTITAGSVTYPNTHGTANQVLSTTGSGTLTWTTPSSGSSNIHSVGESYGGGVVFYTWDNGTHGLIVSLTDQCCNGSTIGRFSAGTATNTLAYNGSGGASTSNQTAYTTITGGGVGAGKKNTLLILASQGLGNGNKYAARYANEYSILSDGVLYDDWYLGSVDEYHLLANNYPQVLANNSFTPLNGPNKDYWTSTEINLTDAFTVYIRTNSTTSNIFNVFPNAKSMFNNGGYGNVRAIRSF